MGEGGTEGGPWELRVSKHQILPTTSLEEEPEPQVGSGVPVDNFDFNLVSGDPEQQRAQPTTPLTTDPWKL